MCLHSPGVRLGTGTHHHPWSSITSVVFELLFCSVENLIKKRDRDSRSFVGVSYLSYSFVRCEGTREMMHFNFALFALCD